MPEESAEESLTTNRFRVGLHYAQEFFGWSGGSLRDCAISEPLVRPMDIEVSGVLLANVVKMAKAEAQEMIQALPFDGPDPGFGKRVSVRRHHWDSEGPNAGVPEHLIKCT